MSGSLLLLAGGARKPPVRSLALTDPAANTVFQRSPTLTGTAASVPLSGTYTGGKPSAVQAKITSAGGATIVDWTTLTGGVYGSGVWSGKVPGVPAGLSQYKVQVRASNRTSVTAVGSHLWYVGDVWIEDGQSQATRFMTTGDGSVTANAGVCDYDPNSGWNNGTTFNNSPHTFMNTMLAATGVAQGMVGGGIGAATVLQLSRGTANYTSFLNQLIASGVVASGCTGMLWNQGDADANTFPPPGFGVYVEQLNTLQSQLTQDLGLSSPLLWINCSLGNNTAGPGTTGDAVSDASQMVIDDQLLYAAANTTNMHWGASDQDITLTGGDPIHWDGPSYTRLAARFAQTAKQLMGLASGPGYMNLVSASVVSATVTNVVISLGDGTDFTVGTAGWEVSGDNGATWVAGTPARVNATTVSVTTGSPLVTTSLRQIRYLYGKLPGGAPAGQLRGNGTLNLPLTCFSPTAFAPTPLSVTQVPTWVGFGGRTSSGTVQTQLLSPLGRPFANRRIFVFGTGASSDPVSLVLTPDDGSSPVTMTQLYNSWNGQIAPIHIWTGLVPTGYAGTFTLTFGSNPFATMLFSTWVVDDSLLNSPTPIDIQSVGVAALAANTNITANLTTQYGGFVLAILVSVNASPTRASTWSGTGSPANRLDYPNIANSQVTFADDSATTATTSAWALSGQFSAGPNDARLVALSFAPKPVPMLWPDSTGVLWPDSTAMNWAY